MRFFPDVTVLGATSSLLLIGDLAKLDWQELFRTDVISYDRFNFVSPWLHCKSNQITFGYIAL